MDVLEKIKDRYTLRFSENTVPPGFVATKVYWVDFQPNQIEQSLESGIPGLALSPRAMLMYVNGELTSNWEITPADPLITEAEFEEVAKQHVLSINPST